MRDRVGEVDDVSTLRDHDTLRFHVCSSGSLILGPKTYVHVGLREKHGLRL